MRLTSIIFLLAIMQVSASTYAQKISLSGSNMTLEIALKKIKHQSGYDLIYTEDIFRNTVPITINVKNMELKDVLDEVFRRQYLTYILNQNTIVIREREQPHLLRNDRILQDNISGKVIDEKGNPMSGAVVRIKGTDIATKTNKNGVFEIINPHKNSILTISYIGYKTIELKTDENLEAIQMILSEGKLEEVIIVSTGYQTLPKERTTGSFEKIDNQLFNRSTGTNVIPRLLGTVAGLYFNNRSAISPRGGSGDNLSIRGISSFANVALTKPLVVLDNIPYEGDLNNLNPNDVKDITILKDAAAASIWGTRAGNGVIVITTKKGQYDHPLEISLNSNVTISEKPDLFYLPQISSSDVIDVEKFLFSNKFYDNKITTTLPYPPFLTPAVELLAKQRALPLTDVDGRKQIDDQINALRQYDLRNDYLKYMYRKAINQQYAINLNGGSKQISYIISAGYDKNLNSLVTSGYNRTSIRSNISFKPVKQLDIQTGFLYTKSKTTDAVDVGSVSYSTGLFYPYARLADDNGNPLAPGMTYKTSYLDNLSTNSRLLDWRNKPLEDVNKTTYKGSLQDILFNLGMTYFFNSIFSANVKYQYENTNSNSGSLYDQNSYYVRNLVNTYTDPNTFNRAIPVGSVYTPNTSNFNAQTIRGQINVNKNWNNKHQLAAIAGAEARKNYTLSTTSNTLYGFNPVTNVFQNLNTKDSFPLYYGGTAIIPNQPSIDDNNNRFTSLFANAAYTYNNTYSVSASLRKDASNVFGDNANKQGSPLWSSGLGWNISNEDFYKFSLLPKLKLRATYGYSGNVITGVPAYAVVTYSGNNTTTGLPFAQTSNPPNPNLRWEKVGMVNIGIDFESKKGRVTGSLEYFDKRSTDLVVSTPIDLTKGSRTQSLNSADLHGKGIDLTLNTENLNTSFFRWNSTLIFSYNRNITTHYLLKQTTASGYINQSNSINPIEGKDAYGVIAYQWAGLDPTTGDPQGYLNGQISKDYTNLINVKVSDLHYFGSSIPIYHGVFRNTFVIKGIELSTNILYKFDYYFKRTGLNYSGLYNTSNGNVEIAQRWQNPGDEKKTNVPSMIYPGNSNRDAFYNGSAAMVEKGDHIRLQDITAAYVIPNRIPGVKSIRVYANVNNVGIIWRANHKGIDPDIISGYPVPRTISLGLNASF